jgi:hypothetical protein
MRLGRQDYSFDARVVGCRKKGDASDTVHLVTASLADAADAVEAQFRRAVRELAIEQVNTRRF